MLTLSFWEEFIIQAVLSFLMVLVPKIKNPTEAAGLEATILFLQRLLAGKVAAH